MMIFELSVQILTTHIVRVDLKTLKPRESFNCRSLIMTQTLGNETCGLIAQVINRGRFQKM
jgi:hypothetical protein